MSSRFVTLAARSKRRAWLTPENAPIVTRCRRVLIPDDESWIAIVSGALLPLIQPENWEQFGALTPEQAAARAQEMYLRFLSEEDCREMIGAIIPYMTAAPPFGCLVCDGTPYQRVDYPELYAALDPVYRVDADWFYVPDLRNRTVIGASDDHAIGAFGGSETHELTLEELPAHTHTTNPHSHSNVPHAHGYTGVTINIDVEAPGVPDPVAAGLLPFQTTTFETVNILDSTVTVNNAGGGEAHSIMQPWHALKYCVVAK